MEPKSTKCCSISPYKCPTLEHGEKSGIISLFLFLAESIPWVEPKLLPNCFAQAMLASNNKYFGPSCNRDGTFAPKQCHLERQVFFRKGNSKLISNYL